MYYTFQDKENLYLVMNYIPGGNLRYHLSINHKFTEAQTKYIHEHNIIHRDIKPENLLLDNKGYLYVTDFGIAKHYSPINYKDTSGTLSYMAPEVLKGENHSFSVDFYALGVIVFECIYSYRPYLAKSKNQMKEIIMAHQVKIEPDSLPQEWSFPVIDFVNQLIQRRACDRLGHRSIREIMNHEWLRDVNWGKMKAKKVLAPYFPAKGDNFNSKYCRNEKVLGCETIERYNSYLNDEQYKDVFKDFEMEQVRFKGVDIPIKKYKTTEDEANNNNNKNDIQKNKGTISEAETKLSNSSNNNNNNNNHHNTSIIKFPCLSKMNHKQSNCVKKEDVQDVTINYLHQVNSVPVSTKLNENKLNHNLSSIDVNINQSKVELPNINKSLIINNKETKKSFKKFNLFRNKKPKINDIKNSLSLSIQSKQLTKRPNNNNNNNSIYKQNNNSLIISHRKNGFFLKKSKSCNNISIPNNKQKYFYN